MGAPLAAVVGGDPRRPSGTVGRAAGGSVSRTRRRRSGHRQAMVRLVLRGVSATWTQRPARAGGKVGPALRGRDAHRGAVAIPEVQQRQDLTYLVAENGVEGAARELRRQLRMAPAVIIASCRLTEVDAPVDMVPDETPGVGYEDRRENSGNLVDFVRATGGVAHQEHSVLRVGCWCHGGATVILSAGFCPPCGNMIRAS